MLKAKSKKSFLSEQRVFRTTSAPSCLVPLFAYDVLSKGKRSAPSGWCFVGSDFNKFPSHGSTPAHTLLATTHVGHCRIVAEHWVQQHRLESRICIEIKNNFFTFVSLKNLPFYRSFDFHFEVLCWLVSVKSHSFFKKMDFSKYS